jgi:tryptophan synthase beta chain
VRQAHSISAGLDYPGIGPEHAHLHATGRASYVAVTDAEALEALQVLTASEGIIPALESAHAIAYVMKLAP